MSDESTDDILSHTRNEEEIVRYDVYFCYDSESKEDKRIVKEIGNQLKKRGIAPWLDEWEVRPGTPWQSEREKQIKYVPVAAVFVGQRGISPWQQRETDALLIELVERQCRVIPIHLPNASSKPELPSLLKGLRGIRWVDSRDLDADGDPLDSLIWGITGKRIGIHRAAEEERSEVLKTVREMEGKISSGVLIASLGESPVEISALYDLLTEQERITIDQVIILHPRDENIGRAYELVRKVLVSRCKLQCKILPFEDVNSWRDACLFLKELYSLLDTCQIRDDTVYLSLAGGCKSMAALMASAIPFFSCVKHLYHVIDPDEKYFLSIDDLEFSMTPLKRNSAMHPDLEQLILVDIPFKPREQIDQQRISFLLMATEDELERMQDEMEKVAFVQALAQGGKILEGLVTERVMKQFYIMHQHDREAAQGVRDRLERMQSTIELRNIQPDSFLYKPAESSTVYLHLFINFNTPVHPVFYTHPKDIYTASDDEVEQVVICELETGEDGRYRSLQEIAISPNFSIKPASRLQKLPYGPSSIPIDSILIVPLERTSMVATQLYTLLKHQEGRNIHKVILVCPAQSTEIANGAKLIRGALQEADVPCIYVPVSSVKEIDSPDACRRYQVTLEEVIDQTRSIHPDCTIDLALSGGQEGILAMTIFAAQNKRIPYVYHTLITDEQLDEAINQQTTVEALTDPDLSQEERNARLFLQAYEREGLYTKSVLFKIPVFST